MTRMWGWWGIFLVLVVLAISFPCCALAHDTYSNWKSRGGTACCNNHDCEAIADARVRTMDGHFEVYLEVSNTAAWCPVKPEHYLETGNTPNWSTAHVCVQKTHVNGVRIAQPGAPCSHLLCFQPKPLF